MNALLRDPEEQAIICQRRAARGAIQPPIIMRSRVIRLDHSVEPAFATA
jgi:hypothetical protein